jgi:hypothetical protein
VRRDGHWLCVAHIEAPVLVIRTAEAEMRRAERFNQRQHGRSHKGAQFVPGSFMR